MIKDSCKFSIGQLVHHRLFDYRGAIVDVDATFRGTEEWYEQVAKSRPPRDAPWYHVLVHDAEHMTYVAERNLELDSKRDPINHPLVEEVFSHFADGRYVRPSELARMSNGEHSKPAGREAPLYDSDVRTPSHAERARTLVEATGTGTLCTLAQDMDGHPYGSFVTFGLDAGNPVFLVSELAEHTRNLRADPRSSLLVVEPGTGDPLARGRITIAGETRPLEEGSANDSSREAFLRSHPGAAYYIDFKDFHLWRLEPQSLRYIGGYGRMSWVEVADWLGAAPDPMADHAEDIIKHMNEDHAEAMVACCRALTRATDTTIATMTGVDRYGFEMSATTAAGPRPIRLAFSSEIGTPEEARRELVALARQAREKTPQDS